MTTYILEEHRVPNKIILAQKVLRNEPESSAWMPYQVKTIETRNFKNEATCMAYFRKQKQG